MSKFMIENARVSKNASYLPITTGDTPENVNIADALGKIAKWYDWVNYTRNIYLHNLCVPIGNVFCTHTDNTVDTGFTITYDISDGSLTIDGGSDVDCYVWFKFFNPNLGNPCFDHGAPIGSANTYGSYIATADPYTAITDTCYENFIQLDGSEITANKMYFVIKIKANTVMDDVVFKPEYMEYTGAPIEHSNPSMSNYQLTEALYELEKTAFSGSYNDLTDKPGDPVPYLTFTGTESFTLSTSAGKYWNGTIEYSTNKTTWTEWDGSSSTVISSGSGNVLYLRGKNNTHISGTTSYSDYSSFVFTTNGTIACNGDIRTLLDYEDPENTTMDTYCYCSMFIGCTSLTVAPKLPATTLTNYCYYAMFRECTSLTNVPTLPATTVAARCYQYMFYGCTSLTVAPELPATTLAIYCYLSMFYGCTSLTNAPALPATTLANSCYNSMFQNCTSLTNAPVLPATTLANACYSSMFQGCTSLTTIPALPATTLADSCYSNMFNGCTSLTTIPRLPATTLASSCYQHMFDGCTSLIVIPVLPATTLATYCYEFMFQGCTNIKLSTTQTGAYQTAYRIPTTGSGTSGIGSLSGMFSSTGGTFTSTPSINTTYYTCNFVML